MSGVRPFRRPRTLHLGDDDRGLRRARIYWLAAGQGALGGGLIAPGRPVRRASLFSHRGAADQRLHRARYSPAVIARCSLVETFRPEAAAAASGFSRAKMNT